MREWVPKEKPKHVPATPGLADDSGTLVSVKAFTNPHQNKHLSHFALEDPMMHNGRPVNDEYIQELKTDGRLLLAMQLQADVKHQQRLHSTAAAAEQAKKDAEELEEKNKKTDDEKRLMRQRHLDKLSGLDKFINKGMNPM